MARSRKRRTKRRIPRRVRVRTLVPRQLRPSPRQRQPARGLSLRELKPRALQEAIRGFRSVTKIRFPSLRRIVQRGIRSSVAHMKREFRLPGIKPGILTDRDIPGTKSVCQRRSERRSQLFRMGIAGKNKRRSPGTNGTYRRNEESQLTCKTVRR